MWRSCDSIATGRQRSVKVLIVLFVRLFVCVSSDRRVRLYQRRRRHFLCAVILLQ